MPENKHTITIDLNGLNLKDAEFKVVQQAVHAAVLSSASKFPSSGFVVKPSVLKPGGLINGIILDRNLVNH